MSMEWKINCIFILNLINLIAKAKMKISELTAIEELFKDKKWEIEVDKDLKLSLFNKYIDRYKRIDEKSRTLYLDLSRKFLRIKDRDVYKIFKDIYNNIDNDFLNSFKKIHIFPLVDPYVKFEKGKTKTSRPKTKSGEKIKMLIECNEYRELKYSEKIHIQDNFDYFANNTFDKNKDLLILVDDFIGSGRTAKDILTEILKNTKFNSNNIIIITLVAQEKGINHIYDEKKVLTFFKYLKKRAISDYYDGDELILNLEINSSMEQTVGCPDKWKLGYEKSEALVSIMNKSPNNTLPIFWYETKTLIAPFQRYFNYR
jgi:hypothetical protein